MNVLQTIAICLSLTAALTTRSLASELTQLQESRFSPGISGWEFAPGQPDQIRVSEQEDRQVLELDPQGATLGVNSVPLRLGKELAGESAWKLEATLKSEGLEKGVFAFSIYSYDADGKSLGQMVFTSYPAGSPARDWRRISTTLGPGTPRPLPAGTDHIRVRFSFYEPAGNCLGKIFIKQVQIAPHQVAGEGHWPAEILAQVGDLQIRFESRSFWTLYRIDYQGTRLGLDRFGSHYGSVARFPGIGFIGTGHTENADEEVLSLQLLIDGKPVAKPPAEVTCDSITLKKTSRLKTLHLETTITVENNQIRESVKLRAEQATPVELIYHFMHPWLSTAEEYYAKTLSGETVSGEFVGDRKQRIDQPTRWSAIFDSATRKGAVTYVIKAPQEKGHWRTRYWDIDNVYRKHYFVTFLNQTVPPDQDFIYEILTIPFAAERNDWTDVAEKVAADLKPQD